METGEGSLQGNIRVLMDLVPLLLRFTPGLKYDPKPIPGTETGPRSDSQRTSRMQPLARQGLQQHAATRLGSLADLQQFISANPRLFVVTGAGISKASGIATYRDEIGSWKSNTPIQHAQFIRSHASRQRYWARSFGGWPNIGNASPNRAHHALARLESLGYIDMLVTQNVDRLHQKAGQLEVTDLHGRLDQVLCLDCGAISLREDIQDWLRQHNPHLHNMRVALGPDGDADVQDELVGRVKVPTCSRCDGLLKPNVVFYGSSVDKEVVDTLYQRLLGADALLVIGSSLMVYSSFRFCRLASDHGIPMACINQGLTRGDDLFQLKVAEDCAEVLEALGERLPRRPRMPA